eukprot:UN34029
MMIIFQFSGGFSLVEAYPYVTLIRTISGSWAIYCLVLFYHALLHMDKKSTAYYNFRAFRPLPKFICIKSVVFFIFWQGILLTMLEHFRIIPRTQNWTERDISVGIQDCLVCLEMFCFAIAHLYVFNPLQFPRKKFKRSLRYTSSGNTLIISPERTIRGGVLNSFDVRDIAKDIEKYILPQKDELERDELTPLLIDKANCESTVDPEEFIDEQDGITPLTETTDDNVNNIN